MDISNSTHPITEYSHIRPTIASILQSLKTLTYPQFLSLLVILFLTHFIWSCIYNVYFHPLAHFPGPFWAKITIFYEYYYDNLKDGGGNLSFHCYHTLHPKYGPIVRTSPNKLRTNNLDDFFKIHAVGTKFTKDPDHYSKFDQTAGVICMIDNKRHSERRRLLAPLFSKKSIGLVEGLVKDHAVRLMARLKRDEVKARNDGKELWLNSKKVYQAVISDVICVFAFGKTYKAIEQDNWSFPMLEINEEFSEQLCNFKYVPNGFPHLMHYIPDWFTKTFYPQSAVLRDFQNTTFADVVELQNKKNAGLLPPRLPTDPITVFSEMIDIYPSQEGLVNDSTVMFTAGTLTTAYALAHGTYLLATNPEIHTRLFDEIKSIWPVIDNIPSYEELEKLPYFTAVIKEILRLSPGVIGALARRTPSGGATLSNCFVPGDISIDSSPLAICCNPEKFPDPFKFDPERWLAEGSKALEKYSVPFGYGSRNCVGIYLAYLEIHVVLGAVVRGWEWRVDEEVKEKGWRVGDRWAPVLKGVGGFVFKSRVE